MSVESRRVAMILEATQALPAASAAAVTTTAGLEALDDCAVLSLGNGQDLVIGSDFVRGTGFNLFKKGLLDHYDIGAYVVGANVSDVAAMGATPIGLTLIARYAENTTDAQFSHLIRGVCEACRRLNTPLLGGDTGSYEVEVLAGTAIGVCPSGRAMLRRNARPGDVLYVSGDVGLANAAYRYFCRDRETASSLDTAVETELLGSWKHLAPAVEQGQALVAEGLSHCATDTSDGLFAAAELIAKASGVRITLDAASLPIRDAVRQVADRLDLNVERLAGGTSVDFRLLFAASADRRSRVSEMFERHNWPLFEVGYVDSDGRPGEVVLRRHTGDEVLTNCW